MPVNLAGVAKSIHQAATGTKTPFGRTPKVENRTTIPRLYLAAPLAFLISAATSAVLHTRSGFGMDAAFGALTCALLLYALIEFIGPRALLTDLLPRPTT